jgi:hypothetical protein
MQMHELLLSRRSGNIELPTIADPYINNVTLLMHMDTSGSSGAWMDSVNNYQFMVNGGAILSSAEKRFGTTSAYFNGSGSYAYGINRPGYSFGTEDFTIEAYVYFVTLNSPYGQNCIINGGGTGAYGNGPSAWALLVSNSGRITFDNAWDGGGSNNFVLQTPINAITVGKWHHVAVCRVGSMMYVLVNGKIQTLSTNSFAPTKTVTSDGVLRIGRLLTGSEWNYIVHAYYDEIRITKGVGRYNSDFVPYPAPYANPGQFQ